MAMRTLAALLAVSLAVSRESHTGTSVLMCWLSCSLNDCIRLALSSHRLQCCSTLIEHYHAKQYCVVAVCAAVQAPAPAPLSDADAMAVIEGSYPGQDSAAPAAAPTGSNGVLHWTGLLYYTNYTLVTGAADIADAAAAMMTGAPAMAPAQATMAPLLTTGQGQHGPTLMNEEGQEVILKGLSVFGFNSV